ncbi:hypothetical protein [Streptomyces herbicida]|uniref:hypothetical protein n=1 Tax=Streptomyces herbicida TaxID=3065675 RepID=UPI00292E1573|nr:hypothetical protein [Streptomyces sp. NEAU-HV9]
MSSRAQRTIDGPGHAGHIAEPEACVTGPRTKVHAPAVVDAPRAPERTGRDRVPGRALPTQPAGPARAIDPARAAWPVDVVASVRETVDEGHPHALLIEDGGTDVPGLLGIGTRRQGGSGFADHETEAEIRAGQTAITFGLDPIRGQGASAGCPLALPRWVPDSAQPPATTGTVTGPLLISWAAS